MSSPQSIVQSPQSTTRIILSGGGTGGHIYPAIAIAEAIKKLQPNVEFLFVGAKGKMEMEKVPKAGYKIEGLWISGLQRKLTLKNLLFPIKVIASIQKAKKILKEFKPDLAIGTGGYASGPLLKAAQGKGIPTLIQEQNSFPGKTNKWLAAKAHKICVAYDGLEKYFPADKIINTGNPIRNDIGNSTISKEKGAKYFGLNPVKKTVLVTGGSLGALGINKALDGWVKLFPENDFQLIWQVGKHYIGTASANTDNHVDGVEIHEFIYKMDMAYAAADVIISRAGAIAISELSVVGKPLILVPLPTAAEDHQTKNAMALVNNDAAILVHNSKAKDDLIPEVLKLLKDDALQTKLSNNIKSFAKKDAADIIAKEALSLINTTQK